MEAASPALPRCQRRSTTSTARLYRRTRSYDLIFPALNAIGQQVPTHPRQDTSQCRKGQSPARVACTTGHRVAAEGNAYTDFTPSCSKRGRQLCSRSDTFAFLG